MSQQGQSSSVLEEPIVAEVQLVGNNSQYGQYKPCEIEHLYIRQRTWSVNALQEFRNAIRKALYIYGQAYDRAGAVAGADAPRRHIYLRHCSMNLEVSQQAPRCERRLSAVEQHPAHTNRVGCFASPSAATRHRGT